MHTNARNKDNSRMTFMYAFRVLGILILLSGMLPLVACDRVSDGGKPSTDELSKARKVEASEYSGQVVEINKSGETTLAIVRHFRFDRRYPKESPLYDMSVDLGATSERKYEWRYVGDGYIPWHSEKSMLIEPEGEIKRGDMVTVYRYFVDKVAPDGTKYADCVKVVAVRNSLPPQIPIDK